MDFKQVRNWVFYRFLEATFFLFLALLRFLPAKLFRRLALPFLKLLIFFLIPRRRIIKNLGAAFGEIYSVATKRGLARGIQEHFVKNLMDCFLQLNQPDWVGKRVTMQGKGNLEAALSKGNGVIALGAISVTLPWWGHHWESMDTRFTPFFASHQITG